VAAQELRAELGMAVEIVPAMVARKTAVEAIVVARRETLVP